MVEGALFVTGTDTEVGKTLVSCAVLQALADAGQQAFALKPVAAGAEQVEGRWCNEDALALQHYANQRLEYTSINPCLLRAPIAPHLAAALEGQCIDLSLLSVHCAQLLNGQTGFALIEGAGGWRVPLNEQDNLSDLAIRLHLPVLLVVPIRLGCLNHALLTAEAIRQDGLLLAGWVANQISEDYLPSAALIDSLAQRLQAPCLGKIPRFKPSASTFNAEGNHLHSHQPLAHLPHDWVVQAAGHLNFPLLLKAFGSWKNSIKVV